MNIACLNFSASGGGFQNSNTHSTVKNRRLSQKSLFAGVATSTAAIQKRPTDFSHHERAGYWFQLVGLDGRQYGGLYSLVEADEILESFKGYLGQISAREFGLVAECVIAKTATGRGA